MPFDVEKCGKRGLRAIFQDIHPPGIFRAGSHVIGHSIEKQPHAAILQFGLQHCEFFFGAQFGIDAAGIGDVVSVPAALSARQNRRQVNIGNAEWCR